MTSTIRTARTVLSHAVLAATAALIALPALVLAAAIAPLSAAAYGGWGIWLLWRHMPELVNRACDWLEALSARPQPGLAFAFASNAEQSEAFGWRACASVDAGADDGWGWSLDARQPLAELPEPVAPAPEPEPEMASSDADVTVTIALDAEVAPLSPNATESLEEAFLGQGTLALAAMSYRDLQKECKIRGISARGKKEELIERLKIVAEPAAT